MANEYSKMPVWKMVLLYVVIGGIIYGLIYYFVFTKKGGYNYNYSNTQTEQAPVATNSVEISNYNYYPATITVKVGDTVTWTNKDSMQHSATADDKSFDTGLLAQGKSGSVTFKKAGTYTYYCTPHPNMKAVVIVE